MVLAVIMSYGVCRYGPWLWPVVYMSAETVVYFVIAVSLSMRNHTAHCAQSRVSGKVQTRFAQTLHFV